MISVDLESGQMLIRTKHVRSRIGRDKILDFHTVNVNRFDDLQEFKNKK
jgi:hypothetical protein